MLEGVRELPQENGVGGVVPLFPMDVDEEPHPQIRLSIHPAGQGPEQLLGLAAGVERVAGNQDALPCLAKQLLHDYCGVSARRGQDLGTRPHQFDSVAGSLGSSPLLGQQAEHPSDMRWRHPASR